MIKLLTYLPVHVLNVYMAYLSPKWLFTAVYAPSNVIVRETEHATRNKLNKAAYYAKRLLK